jgi:hypothetical protein
MVLKGRYASAPFTNVGGFETASHDFVSTRTYPRINVYLSEGFVSLVLSKYFQSVLKRRRVPLKIQRDMTVSQTWN